MILIFSLVHNQIKIIKVIVIYTHIFKIKNYWSFEEKVSSTVFLSSKKIFVSWGSFVILLQLYKILLIMPNYLVNSEANARRIGLVESCFGSAGQPLAVPGRVLVGEGVLTKSCRKKPKPRQFFLFNDILVYGNIILQKKKYNKQHIIPLEEVRIFLKAWLISYLSCIFIIYFFNLHNFWYLILIK